MEFRRSDVLSVHRSSLPISSDEIPQKPPSPITQKVISFDVSEISQISEIDMNYNESSNANINKSILMVPQNQSTPSNGVTSADQTISPQMPVPKSGPTVAQSNFTSINSDKSSKCEPIQSSDLSVPVLWEYIKRQDEKYNTLKELVSRILEEKADPRQPDPKMALVPQNDIHDTNGMLVSKQTVLKETTTTPTRSSFGSESNENTLITYLQTQSEHLQKLQDHNQKLQDQNLKLLEEKQKLFERNQELKYQLLLKTGWTSMNKSVEQACFSSESPFTDNERRSDASEKINEQNCINNEDQQYMEVKKANNVPATKSNDTGGVEYRKEKEIEKTSTSTMTSLIYDGTDKVVYQKLTTVTTDFKKQCNEVSAHCSLNKDAKATPENRPSPKDGSSSSRRKKVKCRKCGMCSPHNASGKPKSVRSSDAAENGCLKMQQTSPQCGGEIRCVLENCEEKNEVHNADSERAVLPRYENILRNVNELNLHNNEAETTPRLRQSLKSSSKGRKKLTPSPRDLDLMPLSPTTENRRRSNRRKSSSTASNTSTDSIIASPNCSIQEIPLREPESDIKLSGPTTYSTYGLSSPNISKDTKRYMENLKNIGLARDRNSDLKYNKSRTTLVKRYFR